MAERPPQESAGAGRSPLAERSREAPGAVTVIGATGFLGRQLLDRLAGRVPVRGLARRDPQRPLPPAAAFARADAKDAEALARHLPAAGAAVHLAFDRAATPAENLTCARAVTTACRLAGVRRLLHVSTSAVLGPVRREWADEGTPCRPRGEYQVTKWRIEELVRAEAGPDLEVVVIRPGRVFGTGGPELRKMAADLLREHALLRWLRLSLQSRRAMNLVSATTVAAACEHLIALDHVPPDGVVLALEDEAPANTFGHVTRVLSAALGVRETRCPPLPLAPSVLAAVLRVTGSLWTHPCTRFSSARLASTGFVPPVPFEASLGAYAAALAAELRGASPQVIG
jgi:nucleoside-diphosphate-sugar epimerase